MGAIEKARPTVVRPPVGLMLSIGAPKPERGPGRPIDHFRPKEGQLTQYAQAAARFLEVYGPTPKELTDVYFLSNDIADVLDIRLKAWGSSGPRIVGLTNYAELPKDEFEERAWAFDDDVLYFPLEVSEVPKDQRDTWQGEPIRGKLTGPDDPRIAKFQINLEATLSICLPRVMGVGTVAQLTTKGRRSTRNLFTSVRDQYAFFQGNLVGPPFRLSLRPAKSRYFDSKERKYKPTTFYEVVLDTALNIAEIYEAIHERRVALSGGAGAARAALPAGPAVTDDAEQRALRAALATPPPVEEGQLRDEPVVDRPTDAQLNRIARLEEEAGDGAALVLRGVFGVDAADELNANDAAMYERLLEQALPAEAADAEVVSDNGTDGDFTFESLVPDDVKDEQE